MSDKHKVKGGAVHGNTRHQRLNHEQARQKRWAKAYLAQFEGQGTLTRRRIREAQPPLSNWQRRALRKYLPVARKAFTAKGLR